MLVWFAVGLFLWLLAFVIPYMPERVAILLWGNRRRIVLTEKGEKAIDRVSAPKELKITGTILFARCLFDYIIWSFTH